MKHSRIHKIIATATAILALAAPSALAVPAERFIGPVDSTNLSEEQLGLTGQTSSGSERAPVTTSLDNGFDWGAAGVGAAVAGGLLLLSVAGFGVVSRRRQPAS